MCQDALFETRKLVGEKLKACIRSKGFTKVTICKKAKISRPILEELLNGEIDNKSVFDEHLYKISKLLLQMEPSFKASIHRKQRKALGFLLRCR